MSLLAVCRWLESTRGSVALHESLYMYPLVESVHVWTLVVFFGLTAMLDLGMQQLFSIDPQTGGGSVISLNGVPIPQNRYCGGVHEPNLDRYLILPNYSDGTVYSINPDTGEVTVFPTSGAQLSWPPAYASTMGRFRYLPELKAVVFQEANGGLCRLMMMRTS